MRNFGLELEFLDKTRGRSKGIVKKNLIDICKKVIANYDTHQVVPNIERKAQWNIKYDGTCGHELTSPVFNLTQSTVNKIIGILKGLNESFDKNIPIDHRCGFHIHFDISDFSIEEFKKVAWAFRNIENTLFGLYPQERSNGRFSRKLKLNNWNPNHIKYLGYDGEEIIGSHYTCLNTYRYNGSRKTCEVRHAEGTSDPDDVICWLLICALLIEAAKNDIVPFVDDIDELKGFIVKNGKKPIFKRYQKRMIKWVDQRTKKYKKEHAEI